MKSETLFFFDFQRSSLLKGFSPSLSVSHSLISLSLSVLFYWSLSLTLSLSLSPAHCYVLAQWCLRQGLRQFREREKKTERDRGRQRDRQGEGKGERERQPPFNQIDRSEPGSPKGTAALFSSSLSFLSLTLFSLLSRTWLGSQFHTHCDTPPPPPPPPQTHTHGVRERERRRE
jgi:hypothetical protein